MSSEARARSAAGPRSVSGPRLASGPSSASGRPGGAAWEAGSSLDAGSDRRPPTIDPSRAVRGAGPAAWPGTRSGTARGRRAEAPMAAVPPGIGTRSGRRAEIWREAPRPTGRSRRENGPAVRRGGCVRPPSGLGPGAPCAPATGGREPRPIPAAVGGVGERRSVGLAGGFPAGHRQPNWPSPSAAGRGPSFSPS